MTAKRFAALLLAVLAPAAPGCASKTGPKASGKLTVVTTVSPITNIVANVGGALIHVTGIVPEGSNSHTFEPKPSDAKVLSQADIVFINGLHLEEPTRELAAANVRPGVKIVPLGDDTISPHDFIYDFSFPKSGGDPNPHLWTNPVYAKRYAEIVRDELTGLDEAHAADYAKNYEALAARIEALDKAARTVTATVPVANRRLLTYHDSFPYFAREYGWTIIGAVQPADFSEPSAREVAELIRQIKTLRLPAIFGSEVFPSKILAQIARESGAKYVDKLRDDDLPGSKGDRDHSFLALLTFDFRTFMGELGGTITAFDGVETANLNDESNATYRE